MTHGAFKSVVMYCSAMRDIGEVTIPEPYARTHGNTNSRGDEHHACDGMGKTHLIMASLLLVPLEVSLGVGELVARPPTMLLFCTTVPS